MSGEPKDFPNLDEFIPPLKKSPHKARFFADTSAVEIVASAVAVPESGTGAPGGTLSYAPGDPASKEKQKEAEPGLHAGQTTAGEGSNTRGANGLFVDADVPLRERPVNPYAARTVQKADPESSYRPERSLIREVRIYPWHAAYNYYESFRAQAVKLNPHEGGECAEVDFFSYMPQYTQLSKEQLRYYLWWRTNFRRGTYLPAAYSYLLLYLYEQINLSGVIPPRQGQENILQLWLNYRATHPRLDAVVREWLCDYSLLHRLPAPVLPRALWGELLNGCRLKEFYVSGWKDIGEEVLAILLFCNNYDYKKSKFYRADTAELYDRVLSGAVAAALRFLREKETVQGSVEGVSTVTRDAFAGAVCSYRLKRRLEVDFSSFSHTHELRYVMTDVLKYAENAIRAFLGVKSRLTVYQISTELRRVLDGYLGAAFPAKTPTRCEKKPEPDYEKRYDIPARPISPERAARIEAQSWETTKRLVEAFAGGETAQTEGSELLALPEDAGTVKKPENFLDSFGENAVFSSRIGTNFKMEVKEVLSESSNAAPKVKEDACLPGGDCKGAEGGNTCQPATLAAALAEWIEFIRLAAAGDRAGQRRFAADKGMMTDAVADKINTIAGDLFGDVILEDAGGCYTVIPDYTEDLCKEGILV